ncbi:SUKH-4 family immunity protein [Actinomycetota bacterium Odt1-20B]
MARLRLAAQRSPRPGPRLHDCDEEADFERLEREVERIRQETSGIDPLPFQDDETVWSVVGEEIAMGRRFKGDSPGARSLYG